MTATEDADGSVFAKANLPPVRQRMTQEVDTFVSPGMAQYAPMPVTGSSRRSSIAIVSLASSAPIEGSLRESSRLTKDELYDLRDYLVQTSLCEPGFDPNASVAKLSRLTGRQSNFVNVISYATRASEMLSATKTLPSEAPGVMSTVPLPRESVAVLIDAVRESFLPDEEKSLFLFEIFDVDGTGVLTRNGVTDFIEATLVASKIQTYDASVSDIVDKLFAQTADPEVMTYPEFQYAFRDVVQSTAPPKHEANDSARDRQTVPTPPSKPKRGLLGRLQKRYKKYASETHWLALYFLAMVAAFLIKAYYISYDPAVGYAPKIAKGFAQIVMVNTLFLLFPMCRTFVAFLRRFAEISSRVPVDQNIEFHKICGVVMLVASLGHSIAWVCIAYYLRTVPHSVWIESRYAHLTFVRYEGLHELLERTPMWTGVLMLLIAAVAAPLTHPKLRRGSFNAFWVTHLMFVPFLVLILVHGLAMWVQPPQAYYWVLPPIILYAVERRFRVKTAKGGNTKILRVRFSQDTVAIFMEKPRHFHYLPGMYLYLKVPVISTFEWHPFTISSAPEDDYISVHVRNAGDWTGALHAVLRQCLQPSDGDLEAGDSRFPVVFVDGPVGAPSQDYYRYESVVFVGAGIGVTPFASILQSIVHQWQAFRCDRCHNVKLPKTFKLKKIYFYWITRDQEALTWFAEAMNELSAMDREGRLEIHNYYSPLKDKAVIEPLHALQTLVHKTDGHDIISGLVTKQMTHFGRPDWTKELRRIADQHDTMKGARPVDVGVFFCGPKPMGNQIHDDCTAFNQDKASTSSGISYSFHSENF